MNTTHQLLYTVSRCNQQNGCRIITREYIVNGYAIILRVRMTKNPSDLACFIGVMPDIMSTQLTKVREFNDDFIRQYISTEQVVKMSSEDVVNGDMPTEIVAEGTSSLFEKLLDIADALTKTKR